MQIRINVYRTGKKLRKPKTENIRSYFIEKKEIKHLKIFEIEKEKKRNESGRKRT